MTASAASTNTARAGEGVVEAVDERRRVARARRRRRPAGGDRREHGEAERAADLLRRVEEAGGEALVLVLEAGRRDQRQRHEDGAHPERREEHRGQHVRQVGAVDRAAASGAASPAAVRIIPTAATGRTPIRGAKLDARPAETMIPAVKGRNARPGLERPVAEHALDVERVEEEHREHPRHREEHHDVGGQSASGSGRSTAARAAPSRASRSATKLSEQDRRRGRRSRSSSPSVQPSVSRLDDRVDERHQAAGHRDRAGDVVAAMARARRATRARGAARG